MEVYPVHDYPIIPTVTLVSPDALCDCEHAEDGDLGGEHVAGDCPVCHCAQSSTWEAVTWRFESDDLNVRRSGLLYDERLHIDDAQYSSLQLAGDIDGEEGASDYAGRCPDGRTCAGLRDIAGWKWRCCGELDRALHPPRERAGGPVIHRLRPVLHRRRRACRGPGAGRHRLRGQAHRPDARQRLRPGRQRRGGVVRRPAHHPRRCQARVQGARRGLPDPIDDIIEEIEADIERVHPHAAEPPPDPSTWQPESRAHAFPPGTSSADDTCPTCGATALQAFMGEPCKESTDA